jgi:hypothetical protein
MTDAAISLPIRFLCNRRKVQLAQTGFLQNSGRVWSPSLGDAAVGAAVDARTDEMA